MGLSSKEIKKKAPATIRSAGNGHATKNPTRRAAGDLLRPLPRIEAVTIRRRWSAARLSRVDSPIVGWW